MTGLSKKSHASKEKSSQKWLRKYAEEIIESGRMDIVPEAAEGRGEAGGVAPFSFDIRQRKVCTPPAVLTPIESGISTNF